MTTIKSRDQRLDSIRGLSALLIFVFHINGYVNPNITILQKICGFCAELSFIGLHLFFVLSGYSLLKFTREYALSHSWWESTKRRLNRVLPAYFGTTLIWFSLPLIKYIAGTIVPIMQSDTSLAQIYGLNKFIELLCNLLLLQWYVPWPGVVLSGVTWSLVVEVQFYLLFPILVRFIAKHSIVSLLLPLLICQVASLYLATQLNPLGLFLKVSALSFIFVFYAGMWLVDNDRKWESSGWRLLCLCVVVIWALWTTYFKGELQSNYKVFGELLSSATAIILFKALNTVTVPVVLLNLLGRFGKISFSFYLVHLNISDRVTQVVFRFIDSPVRILVALLSSFCLSLLVAVVAYNLFENWNKTLLFIKSRLYRRAEHC
jgi:peptidoglycan/LPS O-acetylase OafA/YrhL